MASLNKRSGFLAAEPEEVEQQKSQPSPKANQTIKIVDSSSVTVLKVLLWFFVCLCAFLLVERRSGLTSMADNKVVQDLQQHDHKSWSPKGEWRLSKEDWKKRKEWKKQHSNRKHKEEKAKRKHDRWKKESTEEDWKYKGWGASEKSNDVDTRMVSQGSNWSPSIPSNSSLIVKGSQVNDRTKRGPAGFGSGEVDIHSFKPIPKPVFFFEDKPPFQWCRDHPDRTNYIDQLQTLGGKFFGGCDSVSTVWNRQHTCCHTYQQNKTLSSRQWCLPGVIVMGTQKGGTTALHSYLLMHPNLWPSTRKELHAYDTPWGWSGLRRTFPGSFRITSNTSFYMHHLNFESTPSYTASPDACKRMVVSLPSSTVFVIILRDPVKRAWSELKMKERRVISQDQFVSSFEDASDVVYKCLRERYSTLALEDIQDHFIKPPKPPKKHKPKVKAQKLTNATIDFNKRRLAALNDTKKTSIVIKDGNAFRKCLRANEEPELAANLKTASFENKIILKHIDKGPQVWLQWCFKRVADVVVWNTECRRTMKLAVESVPKLPDKLISENTTVYNKCATTYHLRRGLERMLRRFWKHSRMVEKFTTKSNHCWFEYFRAKCSYCGNEDRSSRCYDQCLVAHKDKFRVDKCPKEKKKTVGMRTCKGAWCSCFPDVKMPSDISTGFLWRGYYEVHLRNCMRYIAPARMIIVENDELREKPMETLDYIQRGAGVPRIDYSSIPYSAAHEAFDKKYPTFEVQTGWSNNGTANTHPTEQVQDLLKAFYAEKNERLFKLIGKRYDHWT